MSARVSDPTSLVLSIQKVCLAHESLLLHFGPDIPNSTRHEYLNIAAVSTQCPPAIETCTPPTALSRNGVLKPVGERESTCWIRKRSISYETSVPSPSAAPKVPAHSVECMPLGVSCGCEELADWASGTHAEVQGHEMRGFRKELGASATSGNVGVTELIRRVGDTLGAWDGGTRKGRAVYGLGQIGAADLAAPGPRKSVKLGRGIDEHKTHRDTLVPASCSVHAQRMANLPGALGVRHAVAWLKGSIVTRVNDSMQ
ncbi:hypothetical protein C8R43DRAFT_959318 [Mycena crocata]|nr:hypothetical protein C8R43DRAFT_959318 [Mycena crocata]